jgi:hypothetical protein
MLLLSRASWAAWLRDGLREGLFAVLVKPLSQGPGSKNNQTNPISQQRAANRTPRGTQRRSTRDQAASSSAAHSQTECTHLQAWCMAGLQRIGRPLLVGPQLPLLSPPTQPTVIRRTALPPLPSLFLGFLLCPSVLSCPVLLKI